MLYVALCTLLFHVAHTAAGRRMRYLPVLPVIGVAIALYRPDGVLIGVGCSVAGLWFARRSGSLRRYLAAVAACGLAGLAYCAWRYIYFGLLLPLPLYVKSRRGSLAVADQSFPFADVFPRVFNYLPGLEFNLEWLASRASPLPALLILAGLTVILRSTRAAELGRAARRAALLLVPFGLLFCALLFSHQSQNIDWRFRRRFSFVCSSS